MTHTETNDTQLGLISLTEITPHPVTGATLSTRQRVEEIIAVAKLANAVGLDVFAVGEHHRSDYAISNPAMLLGALARETSRIRLTSGTSLIATADPVRLYQDLATVDLLSGGRAEIIVGRGAFTESFALFGYSLEDYDALFVDHLDLLLRANEQERVTWQGRFRPALHDAEVTPRAPAEAADLDRPRREPRERRPRGVDGPPDDRGPDRRAAQRRGPGVPRLPGGRAGGRARPGRLRGTGTSSHMHVAPTSQGARETFYQHYAHYLADQSRGRFRVSREAYELAASPRGALYVGSPQEIIDKALAQHELFGHSRILGRMDIGALPYPALSRSVELFANEVAPALRKATADEADDAAAVSG